MNKVNDERYGAELSWPIAPGAAMARRASAIELQTLRVDAEPPSTMPVKRARKRRTSCALARAARTRKFGPEIPKDRKERAKQARFLQYRGFSNDHIRAVLEGDLEVDDGGQTEPDQPVTSTPDAQ